MSLEQLTVSLTSAFASEDYDKCNELLTPLKKGLIKHGLLVPTPNVNPNDKKITQSILEIGALVSLNLKQMTQFESYINQVKLYYTDQNKSENKNKLISLYLMYLLTKGDLALFHIELEKYDDLQLLEKDVYLSIPLKFEQWIIDGDFNKINEYINKDSNFPSSEFKLFKDDLINSIRYSIAKNLESSYTSLKLENLKLLLFLKEINQSNDLIEEFGWTLDNGIVYFNAQPLQELEVEEADDKIIIRNTLNYAREMESII